MVGGTHLGERTDGLAAAEMLLVPTVGGLILDGRVAKNPFEFEIAVGATVVFMMATGYVFTTAAAAALIRPRYR